MLTIRRRPKTRRPLRPVQAETLDYALKVIHPAFVLEMRLGKTTAAIRWLQEIGARRILVLAPPAVLETWENELFEEGERFSTLHGMSPEDRLNALEWAWELPRRHFILYAHQTLLAEGDVKTVTTSKLDRFGERRKKRVRSVPDIAWLPWDAVLIDESTVIMNPNSQISKVCTQGFRYAKHRAILTGLIAPESDLDVFPQFKFLHGEFMGHDNFWNWRAAFFQKRGFEWVHKPGMKERIKNSVHQLAFVRTAAQAGMKAHTEFRVRKVDMNRAQEKLYNQVLKKYAMTLVEGEDVEEDETSWAFVQRSWLLDIAGGFDPDGKLLNPAIAYDILHLLKTEFKRKKVVIWFSRSAELRFMEELLKKHKITCATVSGQETRAEKKRNLTAFRGRTQVLLAMERCAQFGVDCRCSDTAIYYSNEASNQARLQSLKRIIEYNTGRIHLVIDYATRGTISEKLLMLLKGKELNSKLFMMQVNRAFLQAAKEFKPHADHPTQKPPVLIPRKRHSGNPPLRPAPVRQHSRTQAVA